MATITCPHCGAENPVGGAFCESCGKALPSATVSSPRVVSADAMPSSSAAARMVGDELTKQQQSASKALLIVAILAAAGGIIFAMILNGSNRRGVPLSPIVFVVPLMVSALFFGLYFWSRKAPLPATIVGLCLYGTLVVVNVAMAMSQEPVTDADTTRFRNPGIGILDIVILLVLARAISAGLKYRKLTQAAPQANSTAM